MAVKKNICAILLFLSGFSILLPSPMTPTLSQNSFCDSFFLISLQFLFYDETMTQNCTLHEPISINILPPHFTPIFFCCLLILTVLLRLCHPSFSSRPGKPRKSLPLLLKHCVGSCLTHTKEQKGANQGERGRVRGSTENLRKVAACVCPCVNHHLWWRALSYSSFYQ